MKQRKHPAISHHITLNGTLQVDWQQMYRGEYSCPRCNVGKLTKLSHREEYSCKLVLGCKACRRKTYLTCQLPTAKRKYQAISTHETHAGTLQVNWETNYQGEYHCPRCSNGQLIRAYYRNDSICQVHLVCNTCGKYTYLSCSVPVEIYRYLPDVSCPNSLCSKIGPNGQNGWIYWISREANICKCHFCGIQFHLTSNQSHSWVGSQQQDTLQSFEFESNIWDLRHFYDEPAQQYLRFEDIQSLWYRQQVKRYRHELLKSRTYSSTSGISGTRGTLGQFGQIFQQMNIYEPAHISRKAVLEFIDTFTTLKSNTLHAKLRQLKLFFEWLGLDANVLLKRRDVPKLTYDEPDWLDEPTRAAIRKCLPKIPAPIARYYSVQEFTAARPGDLCQLSFNCLIEENHKWYIQFFQQKVKRWHKIPANEREIRRIIEEQQQWIRQTLGADYPYLFCHFRSFRASSYPSFRQMKPVPKPPRPSVDQNPMVRIIRYMIEAENIRDSNGHPPHFTGKITRSSRLQEVRAKHGMEAAQLYADHISSKTTLQHYAPPTREQLARVDLPFQALLLNSDNRFLPWQSLPESLLKNPKSHELDLEIAPRLVVYGYCVFDPKIPCPFSLFPKCYGCGSFRPSTGKLPLYERQYEGESRRMEEAQATGAELAYEEAKATIEAMNTWLPQLQEEAGG